MTAYYSASARGFFDDLLHDELPADAVELAAAEYLALFEGQARGQEIVPGEDGRPTLADPPPPPPPTIVSMRQARLALLDAGILGQVDAAIASLPSPDREAAQIEWEYAAEVRRDSTTMILIGSALGLSEQQIADLFVAAAAKE